LKDIGLDKLSHELKTKNIENNEVIEEIQNKIQVFLSNPKKIDSLEKELMIFKVRYDDFFTKPF
jgi:hypothetical protein